MTYEQRNEIKSLVVRAPSYCRINRTNNNKKRTKCLHAYLNIYDVCIRITYAKIAALRILYIIYILNTYAYQIHFNWFSFPFFFSLVNSRSCISICKKKAEQKQTNYFSIIKNCIPNE